MDTPIICRAQTLYDFPGEGQQVQLEEGIAILELNKGDIVEVFEQDPSGWWYGQFEGRKGIFPGAFMDVIEEDTQFWKSRYEETEKRNALLEQELKKQDENKQKEEDESSTIYQDMCGKMEVEIANLQGQLGDMEAELNEYRSKGQEDEEIQIKMEELKHAFAQKTREADQWREKLDEVQNILANETFAKQQLESEIMALKNDLQMEANTKEALELEVEKLKNVANQLERQNQTTKAELKGHIAEKQSLKQELNALFAKLSATEKRLQGNLKAGEITKEFQKDLADTKQELAQVLEAKNQLEQQYTIMKESASRIEQEKAALEEWLKVEKTRNKELDTVKKHQELTLRETFRNTSSTSQKLENEIRALRSQVDSLREDKKKLEGELLQVNKHTEEQKYKLQEELKVARSTVSQLQKEFQKNPNTNSPKTTPPSSPRVSNAVNLYVPKPLTTQEIVKPTNSTTLQHKPSKIATFPPPPSTTNNNSKFPSNPPLQKKFPTSPPQSTSSKDLVTNGPKDSKQLGLRQSFNSFSTQKPNGPKESNVPVRNVVSPPPKQTLVPPPPPAKVSHFPTKTVAPPPTRTPITTSKLTTQPQKQLTVDLKSRVNVFENKQ